jgi:hypothetical protein
MNRKPSPFRLCDRRSKKDARGGALPLRIVVLDMEFDPPPRVCTVLQAAPPPMMKGGEAVEDGRFPGFIRLSATIPHARDGG